MKKLLTILGGVGLVGTAVSPVMAMSPVHQNMQQISAKNVLQNRFDVSGDWENTNDENAPDWSLSKNDSDYVKTFGKTVKNDYWQQNNSISVSFTIDFNKLGGNYNVASSKYDLNDFSNVSLSITSQAGQPAHNKINGWAKTTESYSLLDLFNEGQNYQKDGVNEKWGQRWAQFSDEVTATWSKDMTSLKITWIANSLSVSASHYTDGLFVRVELNGLDSVIHEK